MTTAAAPTAPTATILNVHPVDDAGGVHYETTMTGGYLVDMIDRGLLTTVGNIRPDHMPGQRMGAKTRRKIDTWTEELLRNDAVIGNISIRLDPTASEYYVEEDEGQLDLHLIGGQFDCAVDSLSRIKAIVKAAQNPMATFNPETKFQVRIWIADDQLAKRVAFIYNTRGDKVNDTAAKFAHQGNFAERMARQLMRKSGHLSMDNIEVLKNTVSASSAKLTAFNTLAQAIENSWLDEPLSDADEARHTDFLARFWGELVKVRPEFGRISLKDRRDLRGTSMAGTALSIHGVIAVADALFRNGINPATSLAGLRSAVVVDGRDADYFSYENPVWQRIGVLVPSTDSGGNQRLSLRMSFQTREAIGKELKAKLGLPT